MTAPTTDAVRALIERNRVFLTHIQEDRANGLRQVYSPGTIAELDSLRAYALPIAEERDALRAALRECVVAAGGCASPEVSTAFLLRVPIEVRALAAEVARLRSKGE